MHRVLYRPPLLHGLHFPISSKGPLTCTVFFTDLCYTSYVELWSTGNNSMVHHGYRSDDQSHHERTLRNIRSQFRQWITVINWVVKMFFEQWDMAWYVQYSKYIKSVCLCTILQCYMITEGICGPAPFLLW